MSSPLTSEIIKISINPLKQVEISGTSDIINVLATDKDGNVYAGSYNGTVYKSDGINPFTTLSYVSGIKKLVVGTDSNIYVSTSDALWKIDATGNATKIWDFYQLRISIYTFKVFGSVIYAGGSNGVYIGNNGRNFSKISGTSGIIYGLAFVGGALYAEGSNGVFKSTSLVSFSKFSNISKVSNLTNSLNNIYASFSDGFIYHLTNDGNYFKMKLDNEKILELKSDGTNIFALGEKNLYKYLDI